MRRALWILAALCLFAPTAKAAVPAPVDVTACETILNAASTTYVLQNNITCNNTALIVGSACDNCTLNLNGFTVTYGAAQTETSVAGIFAAFNWDTATNCNNFSTSEAWCLGRPDNFTVLGPGSILAHANATGPFSGAIRTGQGTGAVGQGKTLTITNVTMSAPANAIDGGILWMMGPFKRATVTGGTWTDAGREVSNRHQDFGYKSKMGGSTTGMEIGDIYSGITMDIGRQGGLSLVAPAATSLANGSQALNNIIKNSANYTNDFCIKSASAPYSTITGNTCNADGSQTGANGLVTGGRGIMSSSANSVVSNNTVSVKEQKRNREYQDGARTISSISDVAGVCSVTTSSNHGLIVGEYFDISGTTNYNTIARIVATAPTGTTLTYTDGCPASAATETSGTLHDLGCQIGGVYGIQFDSGGANQTLNDNDVTAFADACQGFALRFTDVPNPTNATFTGGFYRAKRVGSSSQNLAVISTSSDTGNTPFNSGILFQNLTMQTDRWFYYLRLGSIGAPGMRMSGVTLRKGDNPTTLAFIRIDAGYTQGGPYWMDDVTLANGLTQADLKASSIGGTSSCNGTSGLDAVCWGQRWTLTLTVRETGTETLLSGVIVTVKDSTGAVVDSDTTNGSGVAVLGPLVEWQKTVTSGVAAEAARTPHTIDLSKAGYTASLGNSQSMTATVSATLHLTPTGGSAPIVSLSPSSWAFADTVINTVSATKNIVITNSGDANLNISSVALLTGTQFSITADTGEATVAPAGTRTVTVRFNPVTCGAGCPIAYNDTLRIVDNASGSPHDVSLSGTALSPPVVPPEFPGPAIRPILFSLLGCPVGLALKCRDDGVDALRCICA